MSPRCASRYLRAFLALHVLKIPVVSIAGASKRLPKVGRQGADCQRGTELGAAVLHPMFEVARGHQKRDQLALCPIEPAAGGQVQLRLGPHVLGNHRQFKGCAKTTDRLASFTDFFRFCSVMKTLRINHLPRNSRVSCRKMRHKATSSVKSWDSNA